MYNQQYEDDSKPTQYNNDALQDSVERRKIFVKKVKDIVQSNFLMGDDQKNGVINKYQSTEENNSSIEAADKDVEIDFTNIENTKLYNSNWHQKRSRSKMKQKKLQTKALSLDDLGCLKIDLSKSVIAEVDEANIQNYAEKGNECEKVEGVTEIKWDQHTILLRNVGDAPRPAISSKYYTGFNATMNHRSDEGRPHLQWHFTYPDLTRRNTARSATFWQMPFRHKLYEEIFNRGHLDLRMKEYCSGGGIFAPTGDIYSYFQTRRQNPPEYQAPTYYSLKQSLATTGAHTKAKPHHISEHGILEV